MCKLCQEESKELCHFILNCTRLKQIKRDIMPLQHQQNENWEEILQDFLLMKARMKMKWKRWLYKHWKTRKSKLMKLQN